MQKEFKRMLLVNALLSILFLIFNYAFYYFSSRFEGLIALWNPFWLTIINNKVAATFGDFGAQYPNFSFYFFWIVLAVNVYFLYRLQKSAYLKQ
jgi:hypothetical protein